MKAEDREVLTGEKCMFCGTDNLTLTEGVVDIPYFGLTHIFTMDCSNCKYHKSDIEAEEDNDPCKFTIEVDSEEDMNIRVIKSAEATVKIPYVGEITPGEASNGYVTNIEGLLNKFKSITESLRDEAEDKSDRNKAKNIIKKLQNAMWGRQKLKIMIEDPTGNSAIISEKAEKKKL